MAIVLKFDNSRMIPDKEQYRALIEAIDAQAGIVYDPNITAEEVRESMVANGVRPEDNGASRELLKMRYGEDYEQED